MIQKESRRATRAKRHMRIRRRLSGDTNRPRLCVFRSNKHIYVQIIDDSSKATLVAASTLDGELKDKVQKSWDCEGAKAVGQLIAKRAKAKGIESVVFDRGGHIYHGRVAALADAARQSGLNF